MSVSQAKALAADPTIAPGVMVRLANAYPETWEVLLANPSTYPELRGWLKKSIDDAASDNSAAQGETASRRTSKKASTSKPTRRKRRLVRTKTAFTRSLVAVVLASVMVGGLVYAREQVLIAQPEPGIISTLDIRNYSDAPAWRYQLSGDVDSECADYSIKSFSQGMATVLVQNDVTKEECRDAEEPMSSTLALLDLQTGVERWKIDFAAELSWTTKWQKQLIEVPGLDVIMVKFVDVNGEDAGADSATTDEDDPDRKMKTIVPYNALNGRITDAVIAGSDVQPTLQAPVLEVLGIPGNPSEILVMSNGSKSDFRYSRFEAKKPTDAIWYLESDLQPVEGNPLVGNSFVLGRDEEDEPIAIDIDTGQEVDWRGRAGGQLLNINGNHVQVFSDCDVSSVSNEDCQGGREGKETILYGIDKAGNELWTKETTGFAVSRDDSYRTQRTSQLLDYLFVLSGEDNHDLSLLDPATGVARWSLQIEAYQFVISRSGNSVFVPLYFTKEEEDESSTFSLLNTRGPVLGQELAIAGDSERIDGASNFTGYLVDDPDRAVYIADIESGDSPTVKSEEADEEDSEEEIRTCVRGINLVSSSELWSRQCNDRQSIIKVSGYWLLVDRTSGSEELIPLAIMEVID
jgi:outer membrane protein assembly factor BamB